MKPVVDTGVILCQFMNLNARRVAKLLTTWHPICGRSRLSRRVRIANPKTPCGRFRFLRLPMPHQRDRPHPWPAVADAAAALADAVHTIKVFAGARENSTGKLVVPGGNAI
jgi:hypothetical protein